MLPLFRALAVGCHALDIVAPLGSNMQKESIKPMLLNTPQAAALWGMGTPTFKDLLAQAIAPSPVNLPGPPMFNRKEQEQAIAFLGKARW
jgi:hypothetical protein